MHGISISLGQRQSGALLRKLDRQQVERIVDADADAERDHRQRRDLHADAECDHQCLAQDRGHCQRHDRHDDRAPAPERDEAQHDHRCVHVEQHRAVGLLDDDVRRRFDAGAACGEKELPLLVAV